MYADNIAQKNLLDQFLKEHGVVLSAETLSKLYAYADLVVETKEFGNLISAKDSEKFLSRHIADSLVPYIYIDNILLDGSRRGQSPLQDDVLSMPNGGAHSRMTCGQSSFPVPNSSNDSQQSLSSIKWADMGAGAGCPVFPLAIAMPEIQFFAVEPRHMRVKFMQMVKEKLHLDNLTVVGKRFETSGLGDLDFISCRALSTFENDWERAQPALKKGGRFVTLKSFNNIVHLENDPAVSIQKYTLPLEEQVYALVSRGNE